METTETLKQLIKTVSYIYSKNQTEIAGDLGFTKQQLSDAMAGRVKNVDRYTEAIRSRYPDAARLPSADSISTEYGNSCTGMASVIQLLQEELRSQRETIASQQKTIETLTDLLKNSRN